MLIAKFIEYSLPNKLLECNNLHIINEPIAQWSSNDGFKKRLDRLLYEQIISLFSLVYTGS